MFLNYLALGILFFVVITLFYAIIAIHDVPYEIAKHRNHPHQDAIHVAGWVSLFTLHAIWPFLWIWAMTYRPDRGWGLSERGGPESLDQLSLGLARLEERVAHLEQSRGDGTRGGRGKSHRRRSSDGTPVDPHLCGDLLRDLQGLQSPG